MTLKKLYLWISILSFTQALLISLIILLFFRFLPPKLPLFYSLPWGDEQLVSHIQFFIIPGIIVLITLLNLIVSLHLHEQQLFFKKILLIGTLVFIPILTITFIKIVLIFV